MKKTYIIFGLIISLILTGCGIDGLIVKETPENVKLEQKSSSLEQKDNKIKYENKAENFSFKFLSGWTFEENKYGFNVIVFSPKDDEIKENVGISVQQLQKFLSVQEYYEETINKLENTIKTFSKTKTKDIEIGNLKGKTIGYEYKEGDIIIKSKETFLMSTKNKVYIINYTATKDTFEKFLEGAETILNTFEVAK